MKQIRIPLLSAFIGSDKYASIPLIFTFISIIVTIAAIAYLNRLLPPNIPLFYSLPWGSAQLTDKSQLFLLPIISLSIAILNFIFYSQLHQTQVILKRMLLLNIFAVNLIVIVAIFKIVTTFF